MQSAGLIEQQTAALEIVRREALGSGPYAPYSRWFG
jgi:hypothetical protein